MLRLKKLFHKKRCGRATCHVALPLPPLSTAVETSMAGVLMVVEPWGSETIHECKVSLMCVSNSASLVCINQMDYTLKQSAHPQVEGDWLESTHH